MPPAKTHPKVLIFDQAKLQAMAEPLTVRVERVKGNAHQVMPLTIKDGWPAAGQGWNQEEVMGLEGWTLDAYGGGTYRFTVTDANNEQMVWVQMFSTQQYPEKVPAPAVAASTPAAGNPNPLAWASMPATQSPQTAVPSWGGSNFGAPPMPPGVIPFPYQQPFQFTTQRNGYGPQPSAPANDELGRLRQEAEAARLQAIEERHKRELDRVLDDNRRMNEQARTAAAPSEDPAMRERLEREREERFKASLDAERARADAAIQLMLAKIEAQKQTGPSEADQRVARLEEENRRTEERRRQEDQIKEMRDESRRREDQMMAMITALKDQPRGPDPMIQMMMMQNQQQMEAAKEGARMQAEAAKESARLNAEAARERTREQADLLGNLKHYMMSPTEVARMINDGQQGQHMFVKSMAGTFNDVAGVMRDWFQNMAQTMGGQPESPAVRVIEGAVASAKDMCERWNQGKTQTEVARANAQARMAQSQAEAYSAVNRPATAPGPVVTPPPAPMPSTPGITTTPPNGDAQAAAGWSAPPPVTQAPPLRKGKTDEEWFGPALKDISDIREAANLFCESVAMDPPRMREDGSGPAGVGPDEAAMMIMQASAFIRAKVKETPVLADQVKAFSYLFEQGMISQLVEVIFPDVHPGYREDCCHFLFRLLDGKPLHDPNEEQDGDDGDDGDQTGDDDPDNDNHDGQPAPPVTGPTLVSPATGRSARQPSPPPQPRKR